MRVPIVLGAGVVVLAGVAGAVFVLQTRSPEPAAQTPVAGGPPSAGGADTRELSTERPAPSPEPNAERRAPPTAGTEASDESRAPTTGALRVESDVPDTSVFIDRTFVGTAPLSAPDLRPGTHTILLSPAGHESRSEQVEIVAGEERVFAVSFMEIRLDAAIDVIHKHTFGSCAGRLRASPGGVTYATADRSDAFTVALTDLETFEVDYLNANLRLKIRRGKTYNFTDPDGNADRLFVFHRDVEKARERLVRSPGRGPGGGR